jgi:hypothetical protein
MRATVSTDLIVYNTAKPFTFGREQDNKRYEGGFEEG